MQKRGEKFLTRGNSNQQLSLEIKPDLMFCWWVLLQQSDKCLKSGKGLKSQWKDCCLKTQQYVCPQIVNLKQVIICIKCFLYPDVSNSVVFMQVMSGHSGFSVTNMIKYIFFRNQHKPIHTVSSFCFFCNVTWKKNCSTKRKSYGNNLLCGFHFTILFPGIKTTFGFILCRRHEST